MQKPRSLEHDLTLVGLTTDCFREAVSSVPDGPDAWTQRTAAFHKLIKEGQKREVRKYHPDVCKDASATARTAEINAAADALLSQQLQPRPQPQVIFQCFTFSFGSGSTSTTTVNPWPGTWRAG